MSSEHVQNNQMVAKTYFDLMEKVGTKGPYQRNVFLIFFLNWFITGLLIMQTGFLFMNHQFDCKAKGLIVENCHDYVCSLPQERWESFFAQNQKISLATSYGPYVCSKALTISLYKMTTFIGIFLGYIIILFFADNFGRKLSVLIAWSVTVVGSIILCVSVNFQMALAGLFLTGAGSESAIRISMAVFGEIVDFYERQKYSVALEISFGLAGILVGIIYYLFDDWKTINIFFLAIPAGIELILFIYYFEETPKFIIQKGVKKALKSLNRIGDINKKEKFLVKHEDINNVLHEQCDTGKFNQLVTVLDIFLFPSLRIKTICCCLIFIFISLLYYGPLVIVETLGFNPYVNQVVVASSQLLAYPLAYIYIERMPRQLSGVISFGISIFFTTILLFIQKPHDCNFCVEGIIELVCVFASRFATSYYFAIFFLYATELFPLRARGQGFGVASAFGAIASGSANIIFGWFVQNKINPMIFETFCGVVLIVVLMFLPETKDKPLPVEIEEIQYQKDKLKEENYRDLEEEGLSNKSFEEEKMKID